MSSLSTKKQNRVLLISLTAVLACTAILIAVTGSANKKKSERLSPDAGETIVEKDDSSDKKAEEKTAKNEKTESKEKSSKSEKTDKTDTDEKEEKETTEKKKEDKEVSAVIDDTLPEFSCPVNGIAIKEHSDNVPVFSYTMEDYRVHNGIDIAASVGSPVYAAADGVVASINDDPMMGVCVSLSHSGGALTCYKGLSEESLDMLSVGEAVSRGDVIGSAGDTALIESAEENHVHFELTVNGEQQNPSDYFAVTYIGDMNED